MNDETLQEAVFAVLRELSTYYPELYREDGMNPMSNRIAGFIMQEVTHANQVAAQTGQLLNG